MARARLSIDKTYMMEAVEELNFLCKDFRIIPNHLKRRLEKMSREETSITSVQTPRGVSLEPSEEFQCLLAELRVHVNHE